MEERAQTGRDEGALGPSAPYDAIAEGYARYWGPVIRPAAERVLELVAPVLDELPDARVLDVGTGTGTLALGALRRWPRAHVTGVDPSGGMLAIAEREHASRHAAHPGRFERHVSGAERMPFGSGAFDVAVSSFVLQLVGNRSAALREIRRVLRAGGVLGWVAWIESRRAFAPDRIADEVLEDAGFDPPNPDPRSGDIASPAAAVRSMHRAGFRSVRTREDEVVHRWDPEGYVEFLTEFDEATLFAELDPRERDDIAGALLGRLRRLGTDELTMRLPVVYVTGIVP